MRRFDLHLRPVPKGERLFYAPGGVEKMSDRNRAVVKVANRSGLAPVYAGERDAGEDSFRVKPFRKPLLKTDAVHKNQQARPPVRNGKNKVARGGCGGRLQGAHNPVNNADVRAVAVNKRLAEPETAVFALNRQPARRQGVKIPAGKKMNLVSGLRQPRAVVKTDSPRPDYGYPAQKRRPQKAAKTAVAAVLATASGSRTFQPNFIT